MPAWLAPYAVGTSVGLALIGCLFVMIGRVRFGSFFHALFVVRAIIAIPLSLYFASVAAGDIPFRMLGVGGSSDDAAAAAVGVMSGQSTSVEQILPSSTTPAHALLGQNRWHFVVANLLQNVSLLGALWLFVAYETLVSKQKQKLEKIL